MMIYELLFVLAITAATFLLLNGAHALTTRRTATKIELRNAIIREENRRRTQQTLGGKLIRYLTELGYKGSPGPLALITTLAWAATFAALQIAGFTTATAATAAAPLTIAAGWMTLKRQVKTQDDAFRQQLIALFDLLAGKLATGTGIRRAIEDSASSVQDPLRAELMTIVEKLSTATSLVDAVEEMADRYPSQGTRALVAALEMDQASGGVDIGPALRQAGEALQADIELEQEATADLQEAKMGFQISSAGILGIAGMMFVLGGEQTTDAFFSIYGLIALTLGGANYALGIARGLKLLNSAGKD